HFTVNCSTVNIQKHLQASYISIIGKTLSTSVLFDIKILYVVSAWRWLRSTQTEHTVQGDSVHKCAILLLFSFLAIRIPVDDNDRTHVPGRNQVDLGTVRSTVQNGDQGYCDSSTSSRASFCIHQKLPIGRSWEPISINGPKSGP